MGNSKGTPRTGELTRKVLAYVAEHPGCTSGEVRRAFGSHSAQALLATLYDKGMVDRRVHASHDLYWHYYAKS